MIFTNMDIAAAFGRETQPLLAQADSDRGKTVRVCVMHDQYGEHFVMFEDDGPCSFEIPQALFEQYKKVVAEMSTIEKQVQAIMDSE